MKGLVARTTKDTKHTKNERLTRADGREKAPNPPELSLAGCWRIAGWQSHPRATNDGVTTV
jgi:hypothetical protein